MSIFKALGKNPSKKLQERYSNSLHFKNGLFENIEPTSLLADNASMVGNAIRFFQNPKNRYPESPLTIETPDYNLAEKHQIFTFTWFGHSSYLIQAGAINILVDPVFNCASPIDNYIKPFASLDSFTVKNLPSKIDVLLLTHDHFDHLDYKTIIALAGKVERVICPLGVESHLLFWGISASKITILDWWESCSFTLKGELLTFRALPARHFSGRNLKRNATLWSSFSLSIAGKKLFLGGDSGYGKHFKEIGYSEGPFDLAILECGQYDNDWPTIHMLPEENILAVDDLRASFLIPVHHSKFALAFHPWQEPLERLFAAANPRAVPILKPTPGKTTGIL